MTLKEYKNQKNPVRGNKVFLKDDEYYVGVTYKYKAIYTHTSIFINGIPEIAGTEYILKDKTGCLYTTDGDGNPKYVSTFYINKLKENKLKDGYIKRKQEHENYLEEKADSDISIMKDEGLM